jgi:hypothetical protein
VPIDLDHLEQGQQVTPPPAPQVVRAGVFAVVVKVLGYYQVLVFDAATGQLGYWLTPFSPKQREQPLVSVADVDGDGVPEFVFTWRHGRRAQWLVLGGLDLS